MYSFNISAPNTVFLQGDPMMEYERTCVAAGLNERTRLSFETQPPGTVPVDFIEIDFPGINLHMKIPLRSYFAHFYDESSNRRFPHDELYDTVREFVDKFTKYIVTYNPGNCDHKLSLEAFFCLLHSMAHNEKITIESSFIVKLSTNLAIGEGLGCSASFAVCLAACFRHWSLLQKGIVRNTFDKEDLETIKEYAYYCDFFVFGYTSIINTTVSVYGSILTFEEYMSLPKAFFDGISLKILLVYTNVSRKMKNAENSPEKVTRHSNPSEIPSIVNNIDALAKSFIQVFNEINEKTVAPAGSSQTTDQPSIDQSYPPTLIYNRLSSFITLNQGFLEALGASHRNVNTVCEIAKNFSLSGKRTGGNRYAFILLPPDCKDEIINQLINEFQSRNFDAVVTSLCCSGVKLE